jgi:hypothetical protein
MPREDRHIHFESDEVYKAIYGLCFQKQMKLPPPGQVVRIAESNIAKGEVTLGLWNPQTRIETQIGYGQDFLAAALMLYCRGCGIPLPKRADKAVSIMDGKVTLRVQIGVLKEKNAN